MNGIQNAFFWFDASEGLWEQAEENEIQIIVDMCKLQEIKLKVEGLAFNARYIKFLQKVNLGHLHFEINRLKFLESLLKYKEKSTLISFYLAAIIFKKILSLISVLLLLENPAA